MNNDWDRDRHEHDGRWFERVAPHSPHYIQCLPDGVSPFEPVLGTAMHWLPMTPDAVFEDGKEYFVAMTEVAGWRRIDKMAYAEGFFWDSDEPFEREHFTHYARITEPK